MWAAVLQATTLVSRRALPNVSNVTFAIALKIERQSIDAKSALI